MNIEKKLNELGIELPKVPRPVAMFIPAKQLGNALFVSGQIPVVDGKLIYSGKVGGERTLEEAQEAAKICAINILAVVKEHLGDLDKVKNIVKLQGFVNSEANFEQAHLVVNAASEIFCKVFGESGSHARTAISTNVLPMNATVEIEAIIEV